MNTAAVIVLILLVVVLPAAMGRERIAKPFSGTQTRPGSPPSPAQLTKTHHSMAAIADLLASFRPPSA
jgi:hypothetical protein